ncbi:MAG: nucleotidyl transferase AbiEii/AbiGii toxin family protein [Candidatus Xenobiia bacterium LiM19]
MSKKVIKYVAVSIRQRLLNLSRERQEDFGYLLNRFAIERFLYRFSQSRFADLFIIKGAYIFFLWSDVTHRPTRDVDLLSLEDRGTEYITELFKEICDIPGDDGWQFNKDSVQAEAIREAQTYGGIRVFIEGTLTSARVRLQFDIGFGDSVTPDPSSMEIPSLLDLPAPRMKIYPMETLISEKYEAMVKLGMVNSRMKDFYDLWYLSSSFNFEGKIIVRAIENTFRRRKTPLPGTVPMALTEEFYDDDDKKKQWKAFIGPRGIQQEALDLREIVTRLRLFLIPPTEALLTHQRFTRKWNRETGWQ